jgi:copper(I)-binding protein
MKKVVLAISAIAFIGACSPKATTPDASQNDEIATNAVAAIEVDGLKLENPRVRLPLGGMDKTAAYVNIHNSTDKVVTIVGGENNLSKRTELHTHEKSADGMMQMRKVDSFEIPAGGDLILEPMGKHIMLFEVKPDLKEGDIAKITLKTADGKKIAFEAPLVIDPGKPSTMEDMPDMGQKAH